jgi:hypothetical protein
MSKSKVKSVCVPLDPDDCGSVISGYVRYPELKQYTHGKKFWRIENSASVSLSDCNRVIQWSLDCSDEGDTPGFNAVKLDRAITALMKLREYCFEANEAYKEAHKTMRERNLAIDPTYYD